jgi:hypothetical protein
MYWQSEFLRNAASWTRNSTYRLDLPQNGFVTGIILHGRGTPVTDSRLTDHLWRFMDGVTKVEVILNGSTVCKSFNAQIAHFLQWLDGGPAITDQHHNYGSSTLRWHSVINFGRYFRDPLYGLDLSRWDNVELRLTNNWTSSDFSAEHSIDVIPVYLRGVTANPFRGYFRTEAWNEYTTVASEKKYLELPVEHKIRRVVIQTIPTFDANGNAQRTPYQTLSDIEFFLRTGLLKVFDGTLRELWYENLFHLGRDVIQGAETYHSDGEGFLTGLGQTLYKAAAAMSHDNSQTTWSPDFEPGADSSTQKRQADSDADQVSALFAGLSLENCAFFDFAQPDEPEGYLDPAAEKTVQLNYTVGPNANDTAATINTVLDRFVPY